MKKINLVLVMSIFLLMSCDRSFQNIQPTLTSTATDVPTLTSTATSTSTSTATPSPTPFAAYKIFGLNYGPYTQIGQDPNQGTVIPEEQIEEQIAVIAPYARWIRTYGCAGFEKVVPIAHSHGLKVAVGAWLSKDESSNEKEIACLLNAARLFNPEMLVVGNETLYRGDLTEGQLIHYLDQVRSNVTGIPVTTADTAASWFDHPQVIGSVDLLLANIYSYWDGIDVDQSVANLNTTFNALLAVSTGKEVWISETGWPESGNTISEAVPSSENAAFYFLNFVSWARKNEVSFFYFEAFDEPWKGTASAPQEAHWGLWTNQYELKPGMETVFNGEDIPDNWTPTETLTPTLAPTREATRIPVTPAATGAPSISISLPQGVQWPEHGVVSGTVRNVDPSQYKVAVYIKVDGKWWTKPYWDNPLTSISANGYWESAFITGGNDANAKEIVAVLVPNGTEAKLARGGNLPGYEGCPKARIKKP